MIRWKFQLREHPICIFLQSKRVAKKCMRSVNTDTSKLTQSSSLENAPRGSPAVSGLTIAPPPLVPCHSVAPQPKEPEQTVKATFYAKQTAAMRGIDLMTIKGSGPDGTILVADLPSISSQENTCSMRPFHWKDLDHIDIDISDYRIGLSKMRSEAKSFIPHYSLEAEINVDKLLTLRAKLISKLKSNDRLGTVPKLTINDFMIKASALACMKVPEVNSSFMEDSVQQHNYVNVSFAVDTKSRELMFSPVVFNAYEKIWTKIESMPRGLYQISIEVSNLIDKVRSGKFRPEEFHGGTFSISNLGMVGSLSNFSSIVYPPQSAVIAIGGIQKTLVPTNDDEPNFYKTVSVMQVTLSCDHRVIDGVVGAKWLKIFKDLIENPLKLLL